MLNHIWLALIAVGILTAAGRDIHDAITDAHAGTAVWHIDGAAPIAASASSPASAGVYHAAVHLRASELRTRWSDMQLPDSGLVLPAEVNLTRDGRGTVIFDLGESAPEHQHPSSSQQPSTSRQPSAPQHASALHQAPAALRAIAKAQGDPAKLRAVIIAPPQPGAPLTVRFEAVRFVWMRAITTAAFDAAGTGVEIAIGLIGIMALWLGVMKVAEEAGLILLLSRAVRPLTVRLFPDVPSDHPAVAAMLMNIAANMLGLGNAATPFGLKAMEELNRINTRAGTASNAMVTFLALNTSCVTLVPATAIAVRAAAGSSDPAIIIGTTFLASLTATIAGVTTSKLLARTRLYRLPAEERAA